jgi:hypothetical protein
MPQEVIHPLKKVSESKLALGGVSTPVLLLKHSFSCEDKRVIPQYMPLLYSSVMQ